MNASSNKYTLILIKDYANLNQVKLSPMTFWTLVAFALLFCIISIFSIIAALFLWFTSKNIIVDHKELQQKYAQAQISLERLLVLEKIVNEKTPPLSKESQTTSISQENVEKKTFTEERTQSTPILKEEKITPQIKDKSAIIGKRNFKQNTIISSKIFSITQTKIVSSQDTFSLEGRLNNNLKEQRSGTITYYVKTKDGVRYNVPAQKKARTYSFVSYKTIITELPVPNSIDISSITVLGIEVSEKNTVLYRTEFLF